MRRKLGNRQNTLATFALLCTAPALAQTNTVSVGHLALANAISVAISGNYAYLADGNEFRICDVSNPTNPTTVWTTNVEPHTTWGYAWDAAVYHGHAYFANGSDGLRIYNVRSPASPVEVAHVDNPYAVNDFPNYTNYYAIQLVFSGNYAYVASGGDGLWIYDISNPTNPITLGHDPRSPAQHIAVRGGFAYFPWQSLHIDDVSNPANPAAIGDSDQVGCLTGATEVVGNFVYSSSPCSGLAVFDVSSPARPWLIGYAPPGGGGFYGKLALSGNFLYRANDGDGLRIYDLSVSGNPMNVGRTAEANAASGVAVSRGFAYVANGDDGLRIYWVGTSSPPPLGIANTPTNTLALSWPVPTSAFAVQENPGLDAANWVTLTNDPAQIGSRNQVILPQAQGVRFYRLVSQ